MVCCSHFRSLGNAFQQEAILEIRQVLDEHNKRKRPVRNGFSVFVSVNLSVLASSRNVSNLYCALIA